MADSPGGKEVGRVSIRVVPDTSRFREELKEQLESQPDTEYEFDAEGDVNEKKLAQDARTAARKAGTSIDFDAKMSSDVQAEARKFTDSVNKAAEGLNPTATVDVDADTEPAEKKLDRFQRRYLNKINKLLDEVDVTVDLTPEGELDRINFDKIGADLKKRITTLDLTEDFAELANLRTEIDAFYRRVREAAVKASLTEKQLREEVQNTFKAMNARKDLEPLKLELDTQDAAIKAQEFFTKLSQEKLEIALRPKIDLNPLLRGRPIVLPVQIDWDRNEFTRGLALVGGGALNAVSKGLYNIGAGAASAIKGFKQLGENGMILVAILALIAPALALVSGALVAFPAALAAIAVPIGAVMLGLDGLKKAAEVLKPEFEALKKVMSDTFQQRFTPLLESLKGGFTDTLTQSLPNVANGLADLATGFRDAITSGPGLSNIRNIIDNIGAALGRAKDGARNFTSGVLQLVSELSNKFPGLADAFNRTGESFLGWVDKITTKDPVTQVSQLDTAMKAFGDTMSELGGLVTDFFNAGWENLNSVDFAASMKGFVESFRSLTQDTLPALAKGFQGLAAALEPVAAIVNAIDKTLSGLKAKLPSSDDLSGSPNKLVFGDLLGGAIDNLTGNDYSDKAKAAGASLATDLSSGLEAGLREGAFQGSAFALPDIGPAVSQQIKDAISVSAEDQKQALKSAFTAGGVDSAVSQQLTQQITAAVEGAKQAMANLGPELQTQIDGALLPLATIGDKVGAAFSTLAPAVSTAWQGIVNVITAATTQIQTAISQTFTTLPATFTAAFAGVQQTVTGAFGLIVLSIGAQAQNINVAVGNAFNQIPQTVSNALGQAVTAAASSGSQIVEALRGPLAQLPGLVAAAFEPITATVTTAMTALVQAVVTGGTQLVAEVQTWPGRISSILDGLSGTAQASGAAVGQAFAAGIASQTGAVASSAQGLVDAARKFFPNSPAEKGPFSGSGWVDKSGASIGVAFADGMSSSMQGVVSVAKELMQAVKDVFGSAEGLTINFNLGAVADQAQAATTAVRNFGTAVGTVPQAQLQALQPEISGPETEAQKEELSRQLDLLEIERKSLEIERAKVGVNQDAIKARLEEIKQQKLQLGLQKNQLDYATKYGEQTDSMAMKMDDFYKDIGKQVVGLPTDFAKATGQQFMQDLGMSGEGAIPNLLREGAKYIFNVSGIGEAMTAQQTAQRRDSLQFTQR